jgi:hypothetical protein
VSSSAKKDVYPGPIITNDTQPTPADIVRFNQHRNLVEKTIEEIKNDYTIQKLPRKPFRDNTGFVLITLWSFNLMVDYKMTVLQDADALFQQLKSLRRILFDFAAIVVYQRCALYLSF